MHDHDDDMISAESHLLSCNLKLWASMASYHCINLDSIYFTHEKVTNLVAYWYFKFSQASCDVRFEEIRQNNKFIGLYKLWLVSCENPHTIYYNGVHMAHSVICS